MKKIWLVTLMLAAALLVFLYASRPPAHSPGNEVTQIEFSPAPLQTTDVFRTKTRLELPPGFAPPPRDYSYLPETKHAAVLQAEQEHAEESKHRITAGKQDAAGIEELKKLQGELDQRLNRILTADEKFEYDLRNSVIAQSLRTTLHPMEPTDGEFRAIYKHRYLFEQRVANNPPGIDAAWKECDTGIRASIGDGRFERYLLTNNKDFLIIYHFFLRERVEQEIIDKLYTAWSQTGARADAIRMNNAISTESKRQQLEELTATCMDEMKQILGTGPGSEKLRAQRKSLAATMGSEKLRTPRRRPQILGLQPGIVLMHAAE